MLLNNVSFKVLILIKFSFQYHLSRSMTKPTKWPVGIPVWSESSLSAWRNIESLATKWGHSKDSDQTVDAPADLSHR